LFGDHIVYTIVYNAGSSVPAVDKCIRPLAGMSIDFEVAEKIEKLEQFVSDLQQIGGFIPGYTGFSTNKTDPPR
jgi:hypothetical protein